MTLTLEEMITKLKNQPRVDTGDFGMRACKDAIKSSLEISKKYDKNPDTLFTLLEEYYNRACNDIFFNERMLLACWEMINGNND